MADIEWIKYYPDTEGLNADIDGMVVFNGKKRDFRICRSSDKNFILKARFLDMNNINLETLNEDEAKLRALKKMHERINYLMNNYKKIKGALAVEHLRLEKQPEKVDKFTPIKKAMRINDKV